jgi:hypothetical protein
MRTPLAWLPDWGGRCLGWLETRHPTRTAGAKALLQFANTRLQARNQFLLGGQHLLLLHDQRHQFLATRRLQVDHTASLGAGHSSRTPLHNNPITPNVNSYTRHSAWTTIDGRCTMMKRICPYGAAAMLARIGEHSLTPIRQLNVL